MSFCIYCGTKLKDEARFCYKCGKPVDITSDSEEIKSTADNSGEKPEQEQKENVSDGKTGSSFLGRMFDKVSSFASDKFPSSESLSRKFDEKYKDFKQSIKKCGILIVGERGKDLSSFYDALFTLGESNKIKTTPINKYISQFENDVANVFQVDIPSEDETEALLDVLSSFVSETEVDLIYYCVNTEHISSEDKKKAELIRSKLEQIPICIIYITDDSSLSGDSFKINNGLTETSTFDAFVINTLSSEDNVEFSSLYNWSLNLIPKEKQFSYITSYSKSLLLKKERCNSIVLTRAITAAGIGLSPLPFSDAALLVPLQTEMIARISCTWNVNSLKKIVGNLLLGNLITNFGKSAVGNLIKLIPGAGSMAGGMVNATVAGALTYALGAAFNETLYQLNKRISEGDSVKLEELFDNKVFSSLFSYLFKKTLKDSSFKDMIKRNVDKDKEQK